MKLKVDNDYLTKEGKKKKKKKQDSSDIKVQTKVGEILPVEEKILLKTGDLLLLHKDNRPGEPAEYDDDGVLLKQAHISCTLPSVYSDVRAGEPILMDDGKIEGIIKAVTEEEMTIEITYAKEGGAKLKADKGINLPHSKLRIKGLTDKDREDLRFVAEYADAVNMSFVNSIDDVKDLISELNSLNAADLGVVLKIETRAGYENLPGILLSAMQRHPVGVMIARGDLAVEVGWKALADIQEKILVLCEAAHVPIVWATQVLETLAKKGRPSRAEITDAAMSQRAECVMLNKGPHIIDTVTMLNEILVEMEMHQDKRAPMLPELKVPHPFNTED
jgi:pyruvate kinase